MDVNNRQFGWFSSQLALISILKWLLNPYVEFLIVWPLVFVHREAQNIYIF